MYLVVIKQSLRGFVQSRWGNFFPTFELDEF